MRYGIFSDIHANLEALEAVMRAYAQEAPDQYLCVGDIVGYAANPQECLDRIKPLAAVTVAGNHDWAAVDLLSLQYFNPFASEAIRWTQKRLNDDARHYLSSLKPVFKNQGLTLVHGTLDTPQEFNYMTDVFTAGNTFELMETNICFVGHSHIAGTFVRNSEGLISYREESTLNLLEGEKYIVNVGSVGQPRDGDPKAAYCVYDTVKKEVRIKRVSYDTEAARKKIIAGGLPRFLGERLFSGR